MHASLQRLLGSILFLAAVPSWAASAKPDPIKLETVRCAQPQPGLQCWRAMVPENYQKPNARKIELDIMRIKAARPGSAARGVLFLEGGPGVRATSVAMQRRQDWGALVPDVDLLFVDQRGTGGRPDLRCAAETLRYGTPHDLWPAKAAHACAANLARSVDLTRYTTAEAVRDLNNVRAALGIRQLDLIGYSYGTRVAQEYMRQYGKTVRAALLIGPEAPSQAVPGGLARQADHALQQVLRRCSADQACAAAFPNLDDDLASLRHQLEDGVDGTLRPGRGIVASYLRSMLYTAEGASALPHTIHGLGTGDAGGNIARSIMDWQRQFLQGDPWAQYLSVTCTEDVPFVDQEVEHDQARGTLLGSYRLMQQLAACNGWPRREAASRIHAALETAIPTLLLVGEFDPATPPGKAAEIVATMPNGRALVIPNRGHGMSEARTGEWHACIGKLAADFLDSTNAQALDTNCLKQLALPPFKVDR